MKLFLHCESDLIEKKNFLAFKIPIAIILAIVPYGFLICWLPFIVPGNYACKSCGRENRKVKEMDLREYERLQKGKGESG